MFRFIAFFIFSLSLVTPASRACTTFGYDGGAIGKSFDWTEWHGYIMVNKRNVRKQAIEIFPTDNPAEWVSKLGSITLNQHGRGFPLGGINEAGLVVEIMIGPTEDIASDDPRASVNELQWIQYVLDNFEDIRSFEEGIGNIRVSRGVAPVHYMICDRSIECALVEYLGGELVLTRHDEIAAKVFTNSSYERSSTYLTNFEGFGGDEAIPTDTSSLSRYVRTASYMQEPPVSGSAKEVAWAVLQKLKPAGGQWQIVYSPDEGFEIAVQGKTGTKTALLSEYDYSCETPVKIVDLAADFSGNIETQMTNYDKATNDALVDVSRKPTPAMKVLMKAYPESTRCEDK